MFKSIVSRNSRVLSFQLTRCKTAKAASMGVGRRTPSQKRAVNAPFPNSLAIRREDKNRWERRAPLTPEHVKKLVDDGLKVFVQPSTLRIFPDAEYEKAGAEVTEDLSVANVILAVKEVPIHKLIPNRTYMFFSHTIKAQEYNMPMLDAILENNIRLFDYERIVDKDNTRLVRFGRYAGYAGMIDFLHGFGNRLLAMGYSTPFLHIGYTHMYSELDNARDAVKSIGRAIAQGGLPRALGPLIFTFTGSGSVSEGARHMFEFLPHKWVKPDELKKLTESRDFDNRVVYGCLATTPDIVEHKDGSDIPVDRQDYYKNPDQYRSTFAEKIAPYTSVLVNCLYWDQRYPRLLTVSQAENLTRQHRFRMIGLADLSADPGGSVEFMQRLTTIDFPFYVYDLENHQAQDNVATAKGVMICSIDNLPTEIPYEASQYFGDSLLPFVSSLARSNQSKDYAAQLEELAPELRDAMITSQGELTPPFQYIAEFRRRNAAEKRALSSKHKVLVLGSGMVTEPLVKYLTSFDSLFVTVASNDVNAAEDIVRGRRRTDSVELDVNDEASLRSLVRQHDVVVSLLPATMHVPIAKLCIAERRHLVTTSYTSPEMAALHDEARAAGVTVLNEIGLDPGIDHLLAMRVINEAEQRGARLTSFVSHCGGLPAPEASGNPFGYKFSWSPLGVLAAGTNSARFRIDNETVELESGTLFSHAEPYDFLPGFNTEALPNRDSLHYAKVYGVPDASTFLRGTLRYRGFSLILDAITQLGLVDKSKNAMFAKGAAPIAWRSAIAAMLPDFAGYDVEAGVIRHLQLDAPGRESEASAVIGAMRWLGLFSSKDNVPQCGSPIESLAAHMHARMGYEKGERDLVLLKHQFVLQEADGSERRQTSSLVVYGDESGTAMARTVGTPAAIAAKLILDEHVIRRGVITPITPDLYYPLLSGLEAAGIKSVEAEVDH